MPDEESRAFYARLGRRVRGAREQANLTQEQLADRLRLTRSSVANLEAGRQRISAYTLALTAAILEVPVSDLTPPTAAPSALPPGVTGLTDPDHVALLRQLLATANQDGLPHAAP